ncbi:MAG TPA: filamentous hemagglutinin N-terminal domain-containing protein, partial [Burkholderiales bacterium]|nr:filamentous hemagglutinin N-terminal domain-containing protein [Burkholderiales bacterium]
MALAFAAHAHALPAGGAVSAGSASIAGGGGSMTITQTSQNVAINWQTFNIGQGEAVRFVQPNSSAVALNRVLGAD